MLTKEKFIVFNKPDIGEEEMSAVMDVMRSGWIGTGKVATKFEDEFVKFYGGGYAVAVSSCTMGLQLACKVLGMEKEGRMIVTTPLTFAATINSIFHSGYFPFFVDVDKNGLIDIDKINGIDRQIPIAGIMPVHYSGSMVDLSKLEKRKGMKIIEDCAHAFGSPLKREGDFQVFSFYANKNITCAEGGMILVKDKKLADEIRVLSNQGLTKGSWNRYSAEMPRHYQVEKQGFKGNLPDTLAAIGLVQLRRWPEMLHKRMRVFRIYEQAFGKMPQGHSTHFYPFRTSNRDQIRAKLHEKGIGTGIHYKALHLEPAYKDYFGNFNFPESRNFPNAEKWGNEELSLPVSSTMTEDDAHRVVDTLVEIIKDDLDFKRGKNVR